MDLLTHGSRPSVPLIMVVDYRSNHQLNSRFQIDGTLSGTLGRDLPNILLDHIDGDLVLQHRLADDQCDHAHNASIRPRERPTYVDSQTRSLSANRDILPSINAKFALGTA